MHLVLSIIKLGFTMDETNIRKIKLRGLSEQYLKF